MTVETINNGVEDLDKNLPAGTDPKSEGDNHIRNIKDAIGLSFPNSDGAWNTTSEIQANGFNANTTRIRNVGTPTDATDAARKGETDSLDSRVTALENETGFKQAWGSVNTAGTATQPGSGDWSSIRISTGLYRLTFTDADNTTSWQNITATAYSGDSIPKVACSVIPVNANQVDVIVYESKSESKIDRGFGFQRVIG